MPHNTPLISTIVVALALAWAFGSLAHRLKIPPLVGYLLAGIAIGPFTPGFIADQPLANELAEIGVILLMFGVGLHFSLDDLLSVKTIAIPGAVVQIAFATALGMSFAWWLGWTVGAGIVFGLALSVASTVVLLRAMQERRLIETERGRIAVGWLIVEDLAMVLALVLLPALAPVFKGEGASLWALAWPVVITLGKVAAFVAVMLIVGKRVIPWVLHAMAHTGSRELFRLSVLVIALGAAYWSAELFGVSFALGAFFAGMILSESELSQRAAQETLPLRDAFAVLFFASVGMLFNPSIVVTAPISLIVTILIIVIGKSLAAFVIVRLFGHSNSTALTISASLAQIGEFSFILASLGVGLALLPKEGSDLILAGAIFSILINPLLFAVLDWYLAKPPAAGAQSGGDAETASREAIPPTRLSDHVVLVGHGRVGSVISPALAAARMPFLVIETEPAAIEKLKAEGVETIGGNAADPDVIAAANLAHARCLLVSVPDAFEGGQVVEQARRISPNLRILARSHSEEETQHLMRHGATLVVMGEHEIARAMLADVAAQPRSTPA